MKTTHVILAFHAHEPLWDLPGRLQQTAPEPRIARGVSPESWLRRRLVEGRNVYRDLLELGERMGIPVAVDMTNELLVQLDRIMPSTIQELARACGDGRVEMVATTAHHTHAALLTDEELEDELRLNAELYQHMLGWVPEQRGGIFFTECSIHERAAALAARLGYAWTFVPSLDSWKVDFEVEPAGADVHHHPFALGGALVGLPRSFAVSQEIWRPLTRRAPDRVKYQGFLLGDAPVFWDDYRRHRPSRAVLGEGQALDPAGPDAVEEYAAVWREAVREIPDGGLLVYLQDLELMDFGEQAIRLLGATLDQVRSEGLADLRFVAPSVYVAEMAATPSRLPQVTLAVGASWAPEIRPALRYDGHYPPRRAGAIAGVDADRDIFRPHPFIFWEAGRFLGDLCAWILDAFGCGGPIPCSAALLADEGYEIDRFPERVRLPLLGRLVKRACNWGWYPEEGMNKRPFLDTYLVAEALLLELRLRAHQAPQALDRPLDATTLPGLVRLPEILLDARFAYLRFGLERWHDEQGADPGPAMFELAIARDERRHATEAALRCPRSHRRLVGRASFATWLDFLTDVRDYCRGMYLALDHVQRAWGRADADFLIRPMYRFLADVYPPRGPAILDQIAQEAEWGRETVLSLDNSDGAAVDRQ